MRASEDFRAESEEAMRLLLKAYEILSNPSKREEYDRHLAAKRQKHEGSFNYREFLKSRKRDMISQSKLILFDLLHSNTDDAIFTYESLSSSPHFQLDHYLNRDDYMDCAFLLAEQFCEIGQYEKAFELFDTIYEEELRHPYFKHFIFEVLERLKRLVCFQLMESLPPRENITYLKRALAYELSRKDKALIYKKMAEIYSEMGEMSRAMKFLNKGLQYNKKLSGIKKLKEKIGFPEMQVAP